MKDKDKENIEEKILEDSDEFGDFDFPFEDESNPSSAIEATEDEPVKNFFLLILLIPVAPIIFVYSLLMRRRQNSLVMAAIVLLLLGFAFYKIFQMSSQSDYIKNLALFEMVDELSPEEKDSLKVKLSTLRQSIGEENLPANLKPMFDISMDMLSINYYYYLMNAGYMDDSGAGGEIALQNALYGKNKDLKVAAWESLKLINTKNARKILQAYASQVNSLNEKNKSKETLGTASSGSILPRVSDSKMFKKQNLKQNNNQGKNILDGIKLEKLF